MRSSAVARELSVTRQVIKLGSSSIASRDGLALDVIAGLVSQIATAQRAGHEIILVTSGAARLGRRLLAFEGPTAGAAQALQALVGSVRSAVQAATKVKTEPPAGNAPATYDRLVRSLQEILRSYDSQDARPEGVDTALPAAVGQPALMALYRQLAAAVGVEVCQILVSRSDLASARAMGDLGQVLREATARGLLPIVNGNDATDPLSALDNDQVAVAVAVAAEASRLLFLTDVRAAYRDSSLSERIGRLTPAEARAVRVTGAGSGRGGMGSKLSAAAQGRMLRRRVHHRLRPRARRGRPQPESARTDGHRRARQLALSSSRPGAGSAASHTPRALCT